MAGAGELNGKGDEGDGKTGISVPEAEKKPETEAVIRSPKPAGSTQVAARTRHDMPEGPEEDDEGRRIHIVDGAKKPEPTSWETELAEREDQQRKFTEQRLSERYTVPVEAFAAGCSSGCALVASVKAFQQAADSSRPFFLMPYLPPKIAVEIQFEMEERTWDRALLTNPDVLAAKVAVMDEIQAELGLWEQETPAAAKDGLHRIASGLIGVRAQMHSQLLFSYAAKGEWHTVQTYLLQLYPDIDIGTDGRARIEQILTNLKHIYHCFDEGQVDDRVSDLFSLLSLEERAELLYKSHASPSERMSLFTKAATEPSLIGATNKEMAVSAVKKLLLDLVSFAVEKGYLAHQTGSSHASRDAIQNLRKDGQAHINRLSGLLEKKTLNYAEMTKTINLLIQLVNKVGAQGLKAVCEDFIKSCKQKNDRECTKALPKIEQAHIDICNQLEKINELQDLIHLLESRPYQVNN